MASLDVYNESLCVGYDLPSVTEYFTTTYYAPIASTLGGIVLIVVLFCFVDTVRVVLRNGPPTIKSHTVWVLAIYPVTCFLYLLPLIIPKVYLLCETVEQFILMMAYYQLFHLFLVYTNGEAQLVKQVEGVKLELSTPPFCCCLVCLPSFTIKKHTVKLLKWQVLQLLLVLGVINFIFLVISSESQEAYDTVFWYLQSLVIGSSFLGLWGLNMIMKALDEAMDPELKFKPKLRVLEVLLPITQLHGLATSLLLQNDVYPCNPPLTPRAYATLAQNSLILLEMVPLAFIARRLYKRELPDFRNGSEKSGHVNTGFNG